MSLFSELDEKIKKLDKTTKELEKVNSLLFVMNEIMKVNLGNQIEAEKEFREREITIRQVYEKWKFHSEDILNNRIPEWNALEIYQDCWQAIMQHCEREDKAAKTKTALENTW